ncbi:hypothetical protein [Massilia aquatica]|uniref:Uncharacterized protein n=1 Tax=Massilia aquatica TaxID=2609000 RepID=A0ABX0MD37_9BURK|nr:hypothetical protein [Massilia aquatica]NHZ44588.1 hypothetical protein [Massilia aquatica]
MNKTIKSHGGILVRSMEALNGFREKYSYWPFVLEADAGTIAVLATGCLTPLGFFLLQSKIDLVEGGEGQILAKGRDGDVFNYGEEGWQSESAHRHDAQTWLGLSDEGTDAV